MNPDHTRDICSFKRGTRPMQLRDSNNYAQDCSHPDKDLFFMMNGRASRKYLVYEEDQLEDEKELRKRN